MTTDRTRPGSDAAPTDAPYVSPITTPDARPSGRLLGPSGQGQASTSSHRRRSIAVGLGITALTALSFVGCSRDAERDYAGYCVDTTSQQRVEDARCRSGHGGAGWYYVRNGSRFPAVGARAVGGSFSAPAGHSYVEGGLSRGGGTSVDAGHVSGGTVHSVTRGGFGGFGGKAGS